MRENTVDTYFNKQVGEVANIANALRRLLDQKKHKLTCALAWGYPCWSGNERIFSVIAHKDRCNLQLFYGSDLASDWPERIEGTGKRLRHIKIRSIKEIDKELKDIVAAGVKLDRDDPHKVR